VHYGYISSEEAIAQGAPSDIEGSKRSSMRPLRFLHRRRKSCAKGARYSSTSSMTSTATTATSRASSSRPMSGACGGLRAGTASLSTGTRLAAPYWLRALAGEAREGPVDRNEFGGAFMAGYGIKDEGDLWLSLLKGMGLLETRVLDGAPEPLVEEAAVACLLMHAPNTFAAIAATLADRGAAQPPGRGQSQPCLSSP
jgi:hypothetical protein